MNREHLQEELIDLGAASDETKGIGIAVFDLESTLRSPYGLSDD